MSRTRYRVVVCTLLITVLTLGVKLNITTAQLATLRTILNDTWDKANHRLMSTAWTGGALANTTFETETTIFNDVWDQPNHMLRTSGTGGGGGGDFSSNTTTSVDGELVLFSGTGGKFGRRPGNVNGYAFLTSGVLSVSTDVASLINLNTFTGRQNSGGALSTAPNKVGTSLPGTCTVGDTFFKSDASAGANVYQCTATNTWSAPASGGGGGGSGTVNLGSANASARYNTTDTAVGPSTGLTLSTTKILTVNNDVQTISASTTLGNHNIIRCVASGGTVVLTAPATSTATVSHYTIVKDDPTGLCQVAATGSDKFNGAVGPLTLTKQYDAIVLDLYDIGSPGIWWYTGAKAQYGYVHLNMKGADLPSSNAAIIDVSEPRPKLLFDASTSWCASWTFTLNPDYGIAPQIVYKYSMTSATTGSASMDWSVWKTTSAQAEDGQTAGYDMVNTCTDAAVPGTAGRILQTTCPLTNNDSMAANDQVTIKACRNMIDTATGNLELMSAQLQYYKQ